MAVSVMFSATSPWARWLKMLAIAPPGEAASSMKPTASIGGRSNSWVIAKATATSTIVCTSRPTITARGNCTTRAKSAGVKARPSPNMITPTAAGSRTVGMSVGSNSSPCQAPDRR